MYKPSDFFVGVMDFFSVLLPGAVLAFLCRGLAEKYIFVPPLEKLNGSAEHWVAFVFAAYLLGQFTFLISATFMDTLYDHTYLRYVRRKRDEAFTQAKALQGENGKIAGVLKWANVYVRTHNAAMGEQLDQLEATSKFFRSITVVLAILVMVQSIWGAGSLAIACAVLVVLSFWRFANQRWKFTQLTYLTFIQMNTLTAPASSAKADPVEAKAVAR